MMIQSKGKLLDFCTPRVMGILNATTDSFYEGSRVTSIDAAVERAGAMIDEAVDILDIGGMSSRPGADILSSIEEQDIIIPVIEAIAKHYPDMWLSVDTLHASTAREAVRAGCHIVNDISGGLYDTHMIETVAALGVPYVIMHMQGLPGTMQQNPTYGDVVLEVMTYLKSTIHLCKEAGIKDVIIDPGFGFGKTIAHNYALLQSLSSFRWIEAPILVGLSRKSMIYKVLQTDPKHALNGTTALHMAALLNGANILRVHDVKPAKETVELFMMMKPEK